MIFVETTNGVMAYDHVDLPKQNTKRVILMSPAELIIAVTI